MRLTMSVLVVASSLAAEPQFLIRLNSELRAAPVDGRLIVVVSKSLQGEPRFQVAWGLETQQIFGMDVDGWKPGDAVEMRGNTPGAPLRSSPIFHQGRTTCRRCSTSTRPSIAPTATS